MENISNNMLRRQLKVYKVKNFVTGNYGYVPKVNIAILSSVHQKSLA